jgi:hypothetical protein
MFQREYGKEKRIEAKIDEARSKEKLLMEDLKNRLRKNEPDSSLLVFANQICQLSDAIITSELLLEDLKNREMNLKKVTNHLDFLLNIEVGFPIEF